jgi:hypothetical protein
MKVAKSERWIGSRAFRESHRQKPTRSLPVAMHFSSHSVFVLRSELTLESLRVQKSVVSRLQRCTAPLREDAVFTESHDLRGSFGPFSRLTPIALDCSLPTCGSTSWLGNGEYLVIGLFVRLGSKALPTLIRASIKLSA